MRKWTNLAAGVAVGMVLSTALYVTAAPVRAIQVARIGVVDFRRVLENYEKMKDNDREVIAKQKVLSEEARRRTSEIQQLNARLAMHTPGSKAYADTERQITTKRAGFETWMKTKTGEMINRQRNLVREVYHDVENAAAAYAKAHGLNLVLKTDRLELTVTSVRELDLRVTLKKALYVSKEVDITDDLNALLNARYRRQKAVRDLDHAVK